MTDNYANIEEYLNYIEEIHALNINNYREILKLKNNPDANISGLLQKHQNSQKKLREALDYVICLYSLETKHHVEEVSSCVLDNLSPFE